MNIVLRNDILRQVGVLVADSVYEKATVSLRDGWLSLEFDSDDLDNIALDLRELVDFRIGPPSDMLAFNI